MRSTIRPTVRAAGTMPARDLRLRHLSYVDGDGGTGSPAADSAAPAGAPAAPAPGQQATPPAAAPQVPAQAPAAAAPAATPAPGEALPDDPAALQRMILDLRRENGSARTNAKQQAADEARQELAQTIGKALGLVKDDEQVDPAKLATRAQEADARARQASVELAVFRGAAAHQGDPSALLDSRAFLTKVADLDPTAVDFGEKVDAAIKDAVTSNPKLKAAQVAATGGAEFTGGPGEQRTGKATTLHGAIAEAYGQ